MAQTTPTQKSPHDDFLKEMFDHLVSKRQLDYDPVKDTLTVKANNSAIEELAIEYGLRALGAAGTYHPVPDPTIKHNKGQHVGHDIIVEPDKGADVVAENLKALGVFLKGAG